MKNQIICITGASGSGKTTLIEHLFKTFAGVFGTLPTILTREPRKGDEKNLIYISKLQFEEMFTKGELMWKKENHGNFYALRVADVKSALQSTHRTLCIISPECIPTLMEFCSREQIDPENFLFLHVHTPEEAALRARLTLRGDTKESIERRILDCKEWDAYMRSLPYPIHFLDNSTTPEAFLNEAEKIIFAKEVN